MKSDGSQKWMSLPGYKRYIFVRILDVIPSHETLCKHGKITVLFPTMSARVYSTEFITSMGISYYILCTMNNFVLFLFFLYSAIKNHSEHK